MNLMEASVARRHGRSLLSLARASEGDIRLPVPSSVRDGQGSAMAARSSSASAPRRSPTATAPTATPRAVEIVESMVEVVEPAGSDTFVVTHIAGKEVIARMRADADVKAGTRMPFAFNLDKAVLFDPATGLRL